MSTMIFVDGTNLFYRLQDLKIRVPSFASFFRRVIRRAPFRRGDLVRTYWYTIEEKYDRAVKQHGHAAFEDIQMVFGTGIPKSGDFAEKGVDALLVADLIYHAAQKNIDYALLVSVDLDFVYVVKRVHDFGCQTGLLAVGAPASDQFRRAADHYRFLGETEPSRDGSSMKLKID